MPTIFSNNSELDTISFQQKNLARLQNQDFVLSFLELVTRSKIFNFATSN